MLASQYTESTNKGVGGGVATWAPSEGKRGTESIHGRKWRTKAEWVYRWHGKHWAKKGKH